MTDTKACRDCGQQFAKSRADRTVRCPACRRGDRQPKRSDVCGVCDGAGTITTRTATRGFVTDTCFRCDGSGRRPA